MVGDHDPLFVQRPACTHQATLGECNQACLHGRESCQVAPVDQTRGKSLKIFINSLGLFKSYLMCPRVGLA